MRTQSPTQFAERVISREARGRGRRLGRALGLAFERDRLKVAVLRAHGISVIPVTGRQVREDADATIARLLAALGRAAPTA